MFAEVGPGGLLPSDFQLVQQLARLSVQQARHPPPIPTTAAAAHPCPSRCQAVYTDKDATTGTTQDARSTRLQRQIQMRDVEMPR